MQEHYNPNVIVRKIRSYNGINMYRYFSEDMSSSDEAKVACTNSFNNINLFKNSSYTYTNGEVPLSNEEALEREAI